MTELPLLSTDSRLDMLDYSAAHMEARGTNQLEGTSIMTHHSDSLITLQLTEVSTWSMQLLTNGNIRCTHTLSPLREGDQQHAEGAWAVPINTIRCYNRDWQLIPKHK